jgi:hypothetical protein
MKIDKILLILGIVLGVSVLGCAENQLGKVTKGAVLQKKKTAEEKETHKRVPKAKNYVFTYRLGRVSAPDGTDRKIRVLVKDGKAVSAVQLYSGSAVFAAEYHKSKSYPKPIVFASLKDAHYLNHVMNMVNHIDDKRVTYEIKYDTHGFPLVAETAPGSVYIYYSNYQEVDENFVLDAQEEVMHDFYYNRKKWKDTHISSYRLSLSYDLEIIVEDNHFKKALYDEGYGHDKEIAPPKGAFLTMDAVFEYVEEKLLSSSADCTFLVEYNDEKGYVNYYVEICGEEIKDENRIDISDIEKK